MLKIKPVLSVVVFSYNHKEYIDKCLESILMQKTKYPYEILLADDCSPDGTAQIVQEKYGERIRILDREVNLGLCRNMYDAYMQTQGKYIFTCAGDDYLPVDNTFDRHINYLEKHEGIFSVSGWHEVYNVSMGTKRIMKVLCQEYTLLDFLKGQRMIIYEGTMRNTFKEDKPEYLCQGSRNNEEVQMVYYALMKGPKMILPELFYTYCYRNSEDLDNYNSTHTHLKMLEDYVKGFRAIEKVDRDKHNFALAKLSYYEGCINYHIQDYGFRGVLDILMVLRIKDFISFGWIKLLMRFNHRNIPSFMVNEKKLIKRR